LLHNRFMPPRLWRYLRMVRFGGGPMSRRLYIDIASRQEKYEARK
jgi:hypothetical protein